MEKKRQLRNETTSKGKELWQAVDLAAERAPKWFIEKLEKQKLEKDIERKPEEK